MAEWLFWYHLYIFFMFQFKIYEKKTFRKREKTLPLFHARSFLLHLRFMFNVWLEFKLKWSFLYRIRRLFFLPIVCLWLWRCSPSLTLLRCTVSHRYKYFIFCTHHSSCYEKVRRTFLQSRRNNHPVSFIHKVILLKLPDYLRYCQSNTLTLAELACECSGLQSIFDTSFGTY